MHDLPERFGFPVIPLPPDATTPDAVIGFLVRELAALGKLRGEDVQQAVRAVLDRENLGSTNLGRGVAIPHAKTPAVGDVVGIAGEALHEVIWPGAVRAAPVRLVCLVLAPADKPGAALRALEALSRRMREV